MEPGEENANELSFDGGVACGRCGRGDESLQFSVHPFVVSTLVEADTRSEAGVFCERCRTNVATLAVAKSVFLGWWSAKGPAATVKAIRTNLAGGEVDKAENAEMHRALSASAEAAGDLTRAVAHGLVAQSLKNDVEFGRRIHALKKAANYRGATWKPTKSYVPYAPIAAAVTVVVLGGWMIVSSSDAPDEVPINVTSISTSPVANPDDPKALSMASIQSSTGEKFRSVKDVDGIATGSLDAQADAVAAAISRRTSQIPKGMVDTQARDYTRLRIRAIGEEIAKRIDKGESILALEGKATGLARDPIAAPILAAEKAAPGYARFVETVGAAARDYRSGAPTSELRKLAKELNRAADMSIISAVREQRRLGQQASHDVITSWVGSDLVVLDIIMRTVIIEDVRGATADCAGRV
jgi:hypothetical protein